MQRSDLPYMALTLVFGLAIFVAGRMSAPDTSVVHELSPATAPSIFVIAPTAEPPMALLPDVPAPAPSTSVQTTANKLPTPSIANTAIKLAESSAVKPEPVFLEETPDLPANPYKKEH